VSILQSFPHKCTIRRRTRTKGALGGSKDGFTNDQTDVVCWEQNVSQKETEDFEKRGMDLISKIYFLSDPSVTERHQIIITERLGTAVVAANQLPLDVTTEASPDASVGLGVVYKVFCKVPSGRDD
jgi:hypothetical protein